MKHSDTVIATTPPKRRKRASLFDLEPIYIKDYTVRRKHVMHVVYQPIYSVYKRQITRITLTHGTYALSAHYAWERTFRVRHRDV